MIGVTVASRHGLRCLDEAMLAATGGQLSPVVTGLVYCDAIAACQQTHALDRAREWTMALGNWCEAQPQLVPFAATCQFHRSEVMQLGGAWTEAFEEARRASSGFSHARGGDAGHAAYQEGEIHRLRGECRGIGPNQTPARRIAKRTSCPPPVSRTLLAAVEFVPANRCLE